MCFRKLLEELWILCVLSFKKVWLQGIQRNQHAIDNIICRLKSLSDAFWYKYTLEHIIVEPRICENDIYVVAHQ